MWYHKWCCYLRSYILCRHREQKPTQAAIIAGHTTIVLARRDLIYICWNLLVLKWSKSSCSKYRFFCKRTTFFRKLQDFSANSQRRGNGPTPPEQGTLPWTSMCVLRRTTRRNRVTASWLTPTASWLTLPPQQCGTDLRGAFSVGGHVPARAGRSQDRSASI